MFTQALDAILAHFGEAVTYKGDGSLNVALRAVFDEVYTYVDEATNQRISTDRMSILFKLTDLPEEPGNRDEFVVRSKSYLITNIEKDGKGGARAFVMEKDI